MLLDAVTTLCLAHGREAIAGIAVRDERQPADACHSFVLSQAYFELYFLGLGTAFPIAACSPSTLAFRKATARAVVVGSVRVPG